MKKVSFVGKYFKESTKFGQLVIFLKLWFTYNKTKQEESHEF